MKQYCRYCASCVYGDVIWCSEKEKEMAESSAKRPNKCACFVFNEIDALGGDLNKKYKPRVKKEPDNSPLLFEENLK